MSMMSLNDKERREILGEVLMDEFKVIREYLSDIPVIKKDIRKLKVIAQKHTDLLQAHEYDFRAIRQQLAVHDNEITQLKQRLA